MRRRAALPFFILILCLWQSIAFADDRCASEIIRLRFTKPIAEILPVLELRPLADMAEEALEQDLRNFVFRLEALFRLYERAYGESPWEELKKKSRIFENALGKMGARDEYYLFGVKLGASEKVLQELKKKYLKDRERFITTQIDAKFDPLQPDNQWTIFQRLIDVQSFLSIEDDRERIRMVLASELRELAKLDFDMNDLENGIHEMRRRARWIVLYILALDGLIVLDDPAVDPEAQRFSRKKFDLPRNPMIDNPIVLNRDLYHELLTFIKEVGALKDYGEGVLNLAEAYVEAGEASSLSEAIAIVDRLADERGMKIDVTAEALRIRKKALDSKLFNRLEAAFQNK